jgi:hypothetical protein
MKTIEIRLVDGLVIEFEHAAPDLEVLEIMNPEVMWYYSTPHWINTDKIIMIKIK